jgi:hypothetical protein
MIKYKTYTDEMLAYALLDCYETLSTGQYSADHTYGRKVWADIDAIRDVQMSRRNRRLTGSHYAYTPSWHTRSNGQPLDTEA